MACLESTQGVDQDIIAKQSGGYNASAAQKKVPLNVVWEVPPSNDEDKPREDFAVAIYNQIKPLNAALLDSYIDGYQRTTTLFFGRIVSNPDDLPAFAVPLGYNMTYNGMATHNGNALHRHNSVEIFVALDAPMEIAYGTHGEHKALLKPWDLVACPAEVIHSYKNMGHDGGQILTFLMGKPAIRWADGVVAEARQNGAVCDDSGILMAHSPAKKTGSLLQHSPDKWQTNAAGNVSPQSSAPSSVSAAGSEASTVASEAEQAEALKRRLSLMGKEAPELVMQAGEMNPFVFRYAERFERTFKMESGAGTMAVHWKDLQPGESYAQEGDDDTLIIVLGGSAICQEREYTHLDVLKQPTSVKAGLQGAILLVTRSKLPHNLNFFFDADIKDADITA